MAVMPLQKVVLSVVRMEALYSVIQLHVNASVKLFMMEMTAQV